MSYLTGYIDISSNVGDTFANSQTNDLLIFTQCNSQNILIGNNRTSNANLTISSNSIQFNNNNIFIQNTLPVKGIEIQPFTTFSNTSIIQTNINNLSNDSAGTVFTIQSNTSNYAFKFNASSNQVASLTGDGNLTLTGNIAAGNVGMFRNRIINGDMRIDQRNGGNSAPTFGVDRFKIIGFSNNPISVLTKQVALSNQDLATTNMQYANRLTTIPGPTTNLMVYLPFDSNVTDQMGIISPTVTGSVQYVPGPITGSAVYFANEANVLAAPTRGTNQLTYSNFAVNQSFSVSFWFNFTKLPLSGIANLFSCGPSTSVVYNFEIAVRYSSATVGNLFLWTNTGVDSGATAITANAWYHLTGVYNLNGTSVLYLNGSQVASTSSASTGTLNPAMFAVGGDSLNTTYIRPFAGYIDDFRIYNRALSAVEISLLAAAASTITQAPSTNLAAYFNFDQNILDSTSNNIRLTPTGIMQYTRGVNGGSALYLANEANVTAASAAANYLTSSYTFPSTFTVCCWACVRASNASSDSKMFVTVSGTSYIQNAIALTWYNNAWTSGFSGTSSSPSFYATLNSWAHLCITFNNGVLNFYGNGTFIGVNTGTLAQSGFMLGNQGTTGTNAFAGFIDDFRIYSRVLTPNEIAYLANLSLPLPYADLSLMPTSNLAVYYPFNNSTTDTSGNNVSNTTTGSISYSKGINGSNAIYLPNEANVVTTPTKAANRLTFPYTQNGALTVSAWVSFSKLPVTSGTFSQFFSYGSATTGISYKFESYLEYSGANVVTTLFGGGVYAMPFTNGNTITFAGSGSAAFADGTSTGASLQNPYGICIDPTGSNLYVADYNNNRIRKIEIATSVVTTVAGSGTATFADGTGTSASFYRPIGICIDSTGSNLYVVDQYNLRIRKVVISTGQVTTIAGSGSAGSTNGTGTGASFQYPRYICIDPTDTNLYVTDTDNHRIRRIVIQTAAVTTFAGSGSATFADGIGTAASFQNPQGICINSAGTFLYIGDTGNCRIRKINIQTTDVTTFAGSGTASSTDGIGTSATFSAPIGITLDFSNNNLYVTDQTTSKIRKVSTITALVTTLAGSGTSTFADGVGSAASFNAPQGLVVDLSGIYLYLADNNNHRIRRITAYNTTSSQVSINTWYHYVFTWIPNGFTSMYINGNLIGISSAAGSTAQGVGTFQIGDTVSTSYNRPFAGYVADFRIYNRALTQTEISNLAGVSNTFQTGANFPSFPTLNLAMNFPFDNNLTDSTANNIKLSTVGTVSYVNGVTGSKALYLANEANISTTQTVPTNYITGPFTQTGTVSVSFWMNVTKMPATSGSQNYCSPFSFYNGSTGALCLFFMYNAGSAAYLLQCGYYGLASTTGFAIVANTWYHITITYIPSISYSLYVNGNFIGSVTTSVPASFASGNGNFVIGTQFPSGAYPFAGYIDDLRIYNAALNQSQITSIFYGTASIASPYTPYITPYTPSSAILLQQTIEANNMMDFFFGSNAANPVTLSCWIKNSLPTNQQFSLSINNNTNRSYVVTTPIIQSNTWRKVSFTIPGETTGTWGTSSNLGLNAVLCLAGNSNVMGLSNVWDTSTTYFHAGSATNLFNNTSNLLYSMNNSILVTAFQLEKGTLPTPFEYRPFTTELQLCRRYFEKSYEYETIPGSIVPQSTCMKKLAFNAYDFFDECTLKFFAPKRIANSNNAIKIYNPNGALGSMQQWATTTNISTPITTTYAISTSLYAAPTFNNALTGNTLYTFHWVADVEF